MTKQIIAHRGATAYAPENTLIAFEKARAMGSQMIEFDVMLSADGKAFVFHDDELRRTTNGRGEFALTPSEVLHQLDAGRWFSKSHVSEKIPTLHDAIQWLTATGLHANIEIKPSPGRTEETTIAVLTHINRFWPEDKKWPLISSFDGKALALSRSIVPEIPLGLLVDEWREDWIKEAQDLQCVSVHLSRRCVSEKRIASIKNQGYVAYVYTVNCKRQAERLFRWGVDAVFSDYPDLLS
ncbi:MAG: glycerophosphodiester phosphodiesterase [Legionellales bacterium]|nr:glycerophosphodiester phosphodiesterase [Legionellales bacterium]